MKLDTSIYLDGGDDGETRQADSMLKACGLPGVEGQTTNPSLIAKNLRKKTDVVSVHDAEAAYRKVVREISKTVSGPISIQVTGAPGMSAEAMLTQARERIRWIPNAVIKFPCTADGLKAANVFCTEGPVNMTLVFSQAQAAAVYAATRNRGVSHSGRPYDVFVSPFVGRLDDRGERGMDVVRNILAMYRKYGDGHVKVLTASVRSLAHLYEAMSLKSDIISLPFSVIREWAEAGCPLVSPASSVASTELEPIPDQHIRLDRAFWEYDISHPLTDAGVAKFWEDWSGKTIP